MDKTTTFFPITFPDFRPLPDGFTVLAADVGGTKTDMALFVAQGNLLVLAEEKKYATVDWPNLSAMIRDFNPFPYPHRFCFAIAGPINQGKATMTNVDWTVDANELIKEFGVEQTYLLNDLEASAYGLAAINAADVNIIHPGKENARGNAAIISPGTGLGEAGLFFDGKAYKPFATEGGHTSFGPSDERDIRLYQFLQEKYGHVSWERLVSGMGIKNIYEFLRDVDGWEEPAWLTEELKTAKDPTAVISQSADKDCPISKETLEMFIDFLGREAANLAVQFNATGGILIGGGIPPKIWKPEYKKLFLDAFFEVGRLRLMVKEVPVYLILHPKTALWGAGFYGAYA